jgi:starvation-inducible DNA-binding protein
MTKKTIDADATINAARPLSHQQAHEIQPSGHLVKLPIALAERVCTEGVENLNQSLADTITLRDLYQKHLWQPAGPTFAELPVLFDKHSEQQIVLKEARTMARRAAEGGDDGTNDPIIGGVIRCNELQVRCVAGHLVDVAVVRAVQVIA